MKVGIILLIVLIAFILAMTFIIMCVELITMQDKENAVLKKELKRKNREVERLKDDLQYKMLMEDVK